MSIADGLVAKELLGSAGSHKEIWNTGCIFTDVSISSLKLIGRWAVVNFNRSQLDVIDFFLGGVWFDRQILRFHHMIFLFLVADRHRGATDFWVRHS